MFESVSSPFLNTGVILDILSLDGYFPNVTDILSISERTGAIILAAYFNRFVGDEYRPYDLLLGMESICDITSSGVTGWNRKDEDGDL